MPDRILLADDDPTVRAALGDALRAGGFVVDEAECAEQALGRVGALRPAIVLSDVRMAAMSGLQLLRERLGEGIGQRLRLRPVADCNGRFHLSAQRSHLVGADVATGAANGMPKSDYDLPLLLTDGRRAPLQQWLGC